MVKNYNPWRGYRYEAVFYAKTKTRTSVSGPNLFEALVEVVHAWCAFNMLVEAHRCHQHGLKHPVRVH